MSDSPAVYREPARSYASAWVLLAALLAGWVIDLVLGGGVAHGVAWLIAIVVVVGADLLATRAARVARSITVTDESVRMGEHTLARADIAEIVAEAPDARVFGVALGASLPRGAVGLAVRLADDSTLLIPTRHPDRLAAVLGAERAPPEIRPAEPGELALLPDIEQRAGTLFRVGGYGTLPLSADLGRDGLIVLVAGRPPVGFARVDEVGGLAHLEQLSVLPGNMRHGVGTALLEAACAWAAGRGYPAITLITFADVPWNAPFYAARGFEPVTDLSQELAELRDWERDLGLDRIGRRVVMRRTLDVPARPR